MTPEAIAADLSLPLAVVTGVCSEMARNPDHAQQLELCQRWGVGWQELSRLKQLHPQDLSQIGRSIAQQSIMIAAIAQGHLAQKLSNPAIIESLEPKELSTISKQQSDIALGWTKEAPTSIGGGNTINIMGGTIQEILQLKQLKEGEKPATLRVAERLALQLQNAVSTNVEDY